MRSRLVVGVLTVVAMVYLVLITLRGVELLVAGGARNTIFGIAVILVPVLAGGLILRELRFGYDSVRLARTLAAEDGIPLDTVERDEFGRIEPAAADAEWLRRKAIVDQAPDDWRAWFLLAIAYDNARDRKQARVAARKAIALFKQRQGSSPK